MEELIGKSIVALNPNVTVRDQEIDVKKELKERLDLLYGPNNTYVAMAPLIKGVSLQFVLDTSPSLDEERRAIAQNLKHIQDDLTQRITTSGDEQVYIQVSRILLPQDYPVHL